MHNIFRVAQSFIKEDLFMPNRNPFSLMYGKTPLSIINRSEEYHTILDTFKSENPSTYAILITGIRGSGKTVLLRTISNDLRKNEDWIVIDANAQDKIIEPLAEKLYYEGNKHKLFIDWSLKVNFKFVELEIKKEKTTNSEIVFEKLLEKANNHGKKVLITIDEVTNTKEIKRFANFYQALIGRNYEIFLLMTGLKNNIESLVSSASTSFLSRTPKISLQPLDLIDVANEYKKRLAISFELALKLANITNGYAFAYQVLGYLFFENKKTDIDDELLLEFDRYLQRNGYDVIWKELTKVEKDICFALAELTDKTQLNILNKLDMKESNYQNYRSALLEKEIIVTKGYGRVDFSLPRFQEFVLLMKYFD